MKSPASPKYKYSFFPFILLFLALAIFIQLTYAAIPNVEISDTQFLDSFTNASDGETVIALEFGDNDTWVQDGGTDCTYFGGTFANCTGATGLVAHSFPVNATNTTAKFSCRANDVTTPSNLACGVVLSSVDSSRDKCSIGIGKGNITYNEDGSVKYTANFTFLNNTLYNFYATHRAIDLKCDYFVEETSNTSNNASLLNINQSQISETPEDTFNRVLLHNTNTGTISLYDYIYVYNGSFFEDPAIRLVNFTIFQPAPSQHFLTLAESIRFDGNITPNPSVSLVNVSYDFAQNRTLTPVCTNCANWTFDMTNLDFHGRYDLNISFTAGQTITEETTLTIFKGIVIENCSRPPITDETLNFTFKDENTEADLTAVDVDIQVVGWNTTATENITFSEEHTSVASVDVCIHPNETLTADYFLDSSRTGYASRRYLAQRQTLTRVMQTIDVYLLASGDATGVTFTVVNERQEGIQGLLLEAYRFRIDGSFDLVESLVTDLKGEAQFQLDQTREYQFIVKRLDGTILRIVERFKPIDTTYTIQVELDPKIILATLLDINNVQSNLSFTNATNIIIANWTSTPNFITQGCLRIDNRTALTTFGTINITCQAGDSGELTFNVTTMGNNTLIASLFVTALRDGANYTLATLNIDLVTEGFLRWGFMGLFVVIFIFFTIIGAIALNSPALTIISVMVGLFLIYFTHMTALSWGAMLGLVSLGGLILYFIRNQ